MNSYNPKQRSIERQLVCRNLNGFKKIGRSYGAKMTTEMFFCHYKQFAPLEQKEGMTCKIVSL